MPIFGQLGLTYRWLLAVLEQRLAAQTTFTSVLSPIEFNRQVKVVTLLDLEEAADRFVLTATSAAFARGRGRCTERCRQEPH